jgi:hypothetical protein
LKEPLADLIRNYLNPSKKFDKLSSAHAKIEDVRLVMETNVKKMIEN